MWFPLTIKRNMNKKFLFVHFILIFSFGRYVSSAPPPCAAGVRCPPGGMWGEWTSFGSENCSMECGGCGRLFETRTCVSSRISNCPCTGDSSRFIPCNMKGCPFPTQKTCCIPYLPMVVNGSVVCGPLPRSMRDEGASCCPVGGLWSDWSGYERSNSQWIRTRTCFSTAFGCPCVGSSTESSNQCPCPQPDFTQTRTQCTSFPNTRPFYDRALTVNHDTCYAQLNMVGHNDDKTKLYCTRFNGYPKPYRFVALLIMYEEKDGCAMDYVFDCLNGESDDRHMNATFTCDRTSLKWIYDYTGKHITSYMQGTYLTDS
uniref:ShKT domain-containing protein n=2 Tax=Caenorhabditis tropicalis TaxID=1561998 RepID=A0A1I7T5A9_9PELO